MTQVDRQPAAFMPAVQPHGSQSASTPAGVLVSIVNYRTGKLVIQGLRALAEERARYAGEVHAVVVDNRSEDGSAELIENAIRHEGWDAWVELVRAPVNGGFSYGNNLAVRRANAMAQRPAFVWLVNPDACVRPQALAALVAFMAGNPRAGICGSCLEDEAGVPWRTAFRFPTLLGEFESALRLGVVSRWLRDHVVARRMSDCNEEVDWVSGASLMIRMDVFDQIGLMDEDYFLYYEETDFCRAAQRAGWQCWYVPDSRVMHIAGQSTGVTGKQAGLRRLPAYWFESRRRYFVKNHGRAYAALTDAVSILAFALRRLRMRIQRQSDNDAPNQLGDMLRHAAFLHPKLPVNRRLRAEQQD